MNMNFVPPASVRRVCDPRWQRFVVMDGGGHYWTGQAWSDDPAEAMLYLRESEAMRAGLQVHETDGATETFTASIVVSVTRDTWRLEELIKYLKQWGRFLLMKNQESRAVKVEIQWDELEEDDRPSS